MSMNDMNYMQHPGYDLDSEDDQPANDDYINTTEKKRQQSRLQEHSSQE